MDNNSSKDSFLKGALILGLAGILVKIIGAFFRIPLGNLIGAEGMGYYQAAYPVYTLFLTLATAGFPTALAKLVSEKMAIGDHQGAHNIFKVSYMVLIITGFVSFLILLFGSKYIVNNVMHNQNAYYSMLAISPALLFAPAMAAYRGYFQGRREMSYIAMSQIDEQIFRVILGLGLGYFLMKSYGPSLGAAGAIMGATVGTIASMLYLIFVYFRKKSEIKRDIEKSNHFEKDNTSKVLNSLLTVAVPITIGAAAMPLVNIVDNVIVIRQLEVAGFSNANANILFGQLTGMAMSIINLPTIITLSMSMSLVPSISQLHARGDENGIKEEIKNAIKLTLYIVLPAAFGLASLATPIMQLLYPNEPSSIGMILLALSPCVIFLGLMQTLNGILQGIGKPMVPVIGLIIGILFKVVISYVLTSMPGINIIGSALGTVAAYLIAVIYELYYIKKYAKVSFSIKEFLIKPLSIVIIMGGVVILSYNILGNLLGTKLVTVLAIAIGGLVYVISIFLIGAITKDELVKMPKGVKIYSILKKVKLMK